MKRRLADWGVRDVGVCPLGVDADVFHPARADRALRERLGLPSNTRPAERSKTETEPQVDWISFRNSNTCRAGKGFGGSEIVLIAERICG